MKYATFISVALLLILAILSYTLTQPLLIVVGLLLMPNAIQCLPWALVSQDEEEEPDPQYNESNAGFHAKVS